jgi:hypothetical protein
MVLTDVLMKGTPDFGLQFRRDLPGAPAPRQQTMKLDARKRADSSRWKATQVLFDGVREGFVDVTTWRGPKYPGTGRSSTLVPIVPDQVFAGRQPGHAGSQIRVGRHAPARFDR